MTAAASAGRRGVSQCDRILEVLADHQPHGYREIHERAGFMRLNSRVAELRSRGYLISCVKAGGDFVYQLEFAPLDEQDPQPAGRRLTATSPARTDGGSCSSSGVAGAVEHVPQRAEATPAAQLSLDEIAA